MTTVAHGRYRSTESASGTTTAPNRPNTATKPTVMATLNRRERRDRAAAGPGVTVDQQGQPCGEQGEAAGVQRGERAGAEGEDERGGVHGGQPKVFWARATRSTSWLYAGCRVAVPSGPTSTKVSCWVTPNRA